MIEQIFEFIVNHPILVGTFVFLLVAFLINEGKQGGATVNTSKLVKMVNHDDAVIVDVRDKKDFGLGHISGAIHIPLGSLDQRVSELKADKPVVLVCKMGQHSSAAGKKLKALGFENVRRLSGGMAEWNASGLPIVKS